MKIQPSVPGPAPWSGSRSLWVTLAVLLAVLGGIFARSFQSSQILFSNDATLGLNSAQYAALPEGYRGIWQDTYWIGAFQGSALPSVSYLLFWMLGPLAFAKFHAPIALLLLGLAAWLFFRQSGLSPLACLLGAVAAALNTGFFSYACWGLGTLPMTIACFFAALAAVVSPGVRNPWIKAALAGAAIGMGVMEGFDTGALMSLLLAAFILLAALLGDGPVARRLGGGTLRLAVTAAVAAVVATQALTALIGTQIQGVAGMAQDSSTKAQRWEEATRWSLPKAETLRIIIPGLFGYRMESPGGGNYWGAVGQTPGDPKSRHSGAGVYAGVPVVILALWAVLQSLRAGQSPYNPRDRRILQFWAVIALVSLLLSWGRHAPFYEIFYVLPYASTIRNPIKFMHPFSVAVIILFAYGLDALWRSARAAKAPRSVSWAATLTQWRAKAGVFDRRWALGLLVSVAASLAGWRFYAARRAGLEAYLQEAGARAGLAPLIATFSFRETGWFVLWISLTAGLLILIQAGVFAGARTRFGALALAALVVADLGRASLPWVTYWNYREIYQSDAVTDVLRAKPYEHRVAILPFTGNAPVQFLRQYYSTQWLQHTFPYFNIQALDRVQTPRERIDDLSWRKALQARSTEGEIRLWELSNTRFILGPGAVLVDGLNKRLTPDKPGFRVHTPFSLVTNELHPARRVSAKADPAGPFALVEYTGAMPRAALYRDWRVMTNSQEILEKVADPSFDLSRQVLVTGPAALPEPAVESGAGTGQVEFLSYKPAEIRLKVSAAAPAVLLLNDKHDPHWSVTVNGKPETLLRCNYIMRGVAVPAGEHEVVFLLTVSRTPLMISVCGILGSAALLGLAWRDARRRRLQPPAPH